MAVALRFRRMGANKRPCYRLVACDSRKARGGTFLENLGFYEPLKAKDNFTCDKGRVIVWLNKGAQPSASVVNFLKKSGVISEWKASKPRVEKVKKVKSAAPAKK